ncbi:MAG: hypothetical protein ACWGMZ_02625, partial [Thermoguttaceae bacterium]
MRKQSLRFSLCSLALWFVVCHLSLANTIESLLRMDKLVPKKAFSSAIETPLSRLEQSLFADAADGRLDKFT